MKIRLYCIAILALFFASCSEKEITPVAYDEFLVSEPMFTSNGAKTWWTSEGNFFWRTGDEGLYVNGTRFKLERRDTCWYAVRVEGSGRVQGVNGDFYLAYYGYENNSLDLEFDEEGGCVYRTGFDVDSEWEVIDEGNNRTGVYAYIPLAAKVNQNNVTLTPCCAVLKVQVAANGYLAISDADGGSGSTFVKKGDIDPVTAKFVNVTDYLDDSFIEFTAGVNYIVLPMKSNQEILAGMVFEFYDGSEPIGTTARSITIKKGYVYDINLMSSSGN